jgi:predicted GTPase
VLVVEDGPTLTHGGMRFGAGVLAAHKYGATHLVDPRPFAVGSIRDTFRHYPHLETVLPAMGYGPQQLQELEATIRQVACDLVVIATPVDLRGLVTIQQPTCRVRYELEEIGRPTLREVLQDFLRRRKPHA